MKRNDEEECVATTYARVIRNIILVSSITWVSMILCALF